MPDDGSREPINPYAAPQVAHPSAEAARVFTHGFRLAAALLSTVLVLSVATAVPAMLLVEATRRSPSSSITWTVALMSIPLTVFAVRGMMNYLSVLGYRRLRRRMARNLRDEGIDPDPWQGVFVQLSPADRPRIYDNFTNWDVGFLFLFADRLAYLGDSARFALPREAIERQWLGPSSCEPSHPANVYLAWRDAARNKSGVLGFSLGEGGTLRRLRRDTPAFAEQLETWRRALPSSTAAAPEWAQLALPELSEAPSRAIREVVNIQSFAVAIVLECALAAAVAWLVAWFLPVWNSGLALVCAATASLAILQRPGLLYREPPDQTAKTEED
jgi:hypothetical protein